jgi:predicted nucleic acid-binding protein
MLSTATKRAIPTDDIQVRIPFTNMSWLSLISTFWSNLGLADVVSKETIREMIPVIDPAKEKKRFAAEKADAMARAQEMASTMRLDSETDPEDAPDGE